VKIKAAMFHQTTRFPDFNAIHKAFVHFAQLAVQQILRAAIIHRRTNRILGHSTLQTQQHFGTITLATTGKIRDIRVASEGLRDVPRGLNPTDLNEAITVLVNGP
jgi:hypothetical protein